MKALDRRAALGTALGAAALTTSPARAQQVDPGWTPWARPGPYLSDAGFDSFDAVRTESFGARQRIALTYFFYWYDSAFMLASRGRTDTYRYSPTNHQTMSFRDPTWFLKEFVDMQDAGLDLALPVYWGEPGQWNRRVAPAPELNLFSTDGIAPMVEALETLRAVGRPFKIGLFFDTTILEGVDLTTDGGREIFYVTIRDFYSKIPPHHWAAIGGRPLVWLYDATRVGPFDQSAFDYTYERFPLDFGGLVPFIAREHQWEFARVAPPQPRIRSDGMYLWGAAVSGFNEDPKFTVAQVGPGFCNTQLGGGAAGPNRFCIDRDEGAFYRRQLEGTLRHRHQILAIETWNELGESSGICETIEHGRLYLDLTRHYVGRWRSIRI